MYAVVAVNALVRGGGTAYLRSRQTPTDAAFPGPVFHYHIPLEILDQTRPGMLAEVSFGSRRVQGVVIALSDVAPVQETKPVIQLLFDEPAFLQSQLDAACWLSEYYCSPLIDCLRLMLPPGFLRQPRTVVRLHPQAAIPPDLPADQQRVVQLVQKRDALTQPQIARLLKRVDARRAVRALVRKGILVRASDLPVPRARPKRANFCRLRASPPQVAAARLMLGRPSAQAAVLQVLLTQDDSLPSTGRIIAQAGASKATLNTLARKGWIQVEADRALIMAAPGQEHADLGRASSQQAVLAYLGEQGVPVPKAQVQQATGASSATLNTMLERGLVQQATEPSAVLLLLSEGEARRQVIELRGAQRQHRVLDYLLAQPAGKWLWVSWLYAETGCTHQDLRALEQYGLIELAEQEVWRDPMADSSFVLEQPPRLTPDQERVWRAIEPYFSAARPAPQPPVPVCSLLDGLDALPTATFLLHGVTGSGKTEIYMRAVDAALRQGRQAIVLVPEISLTPQTIRRFAARFPDSLGVMHSELSDGERYDTWRRVKSGEIRLLIGPRSALLAPMDDVGLIVIDEEHASSYKESDRMPAYHARHVALYLAGWHRAVVIMGSATPDLETYDCARHTGAVHLLELAERILRHRRDVEEQRQQLGLQRVAYRPVGSDRDDVYAIELPPVRVVDMRQELLVGNRSIFSRALQTAIHDALANGEQIILFLNRRGASTFVMCRDCGTVTQCPHCSIPLTYHASTERLTCHHCNYQQPVPSICPVCHGSRIRHFGVGTQRVEEMVQQSFPSARVLRWDRDTTREKGSHSALLDRFMRREADLLIGTQMIAKGLDLPRVTVVGVISADTALRLPDFRAAERTFQLLAQVAGRAGRGARGGMVVIQTYAPDHYAIRAASKHDYASFYEQERAYRQQLEYPPFCRLMRLVGSNASLSRCRQEAQDLARVLREQIERQGLEDVSVLGPAPCFLSRLRGSWRWQVILKAPRSRDDRLHRLMNHVELPPGWRLDVDPLDML